MKDQHDPVTPDEYVLRRIVNREQYVRRDLDVPVVNVAFSPHKSNDADGISVFRELFTTAAEVAEAGRSPAGYYVVRLAVVDLYPLGLTVLPDPDPNQPPGHAVIPELSRPLYDKDKLGHREIHNKLARLASRDIVYIPD